MTSFSLDFSDINVLGENEGNSVDFVYHYYQRQQLKEATLSIRRWKDGVLDEAVDDELLYKADNIFDAQNRLTNIIVYDYSFTNIAATANYIYP